VERLLEVAGADEGERADDRDLPLPDRTRSHQTSKLFTRPVEEVCADERQPFSSALKTRFATALLAQLQFIHAQLCATRPVLGGRTAVVRSG
jgi:hypothetical protein